MENTKQNKTESKIATARGENLPISRKHSIAICRIIKNKTINEAIEMLKRVIIKKKVVPFRGEIPHKKGKGISSGRYPANASIQFIKLLKSLAANASNKGINNPVISEAYANKGTKVFHPGRRRTKFKRAHVVIKAIEKETGTNKNKEIK